MPPFVGQFFAAAGHDERRVGGRSASRLTNELCPSAKRKDPIGLRRVAGDVCLLFVCSCGGGGGSARSCERDTNLSGVSGANSLARLLLNPALLCDGKTAHAHLLPPPPTSRRRPSHKAAQRAKTQLTVRLRHRTGPNLGANVDIVYLQAHTFANEALAGGLSAAARKETTSSPRRLEAIGAAGRFTQKLDGRAAKLLY